MTKSDQQDKPGVTWANIEHKVEGAAARTIVSFTHNGVEGAHAVIAAALDSAVREVLGRFGLSSL